MITQARLGINLPVVYYNLYMILIPVVVVLWFLRSGRRFFRMLRVRAAMLTGRLIHIRYDPYKYVVLCELIFIQGVGHFLALL